MKKTTIIAAILICLSLVLSACAGGTADNAPAINTAVAQTMQANGQGPTLTTGQQAQKSIQATFNAMTGMPPSTPTAQGLTPAAPPAACREQMIGPWQPPADAPFYDYIQVNTEFVDSDYLVSLFWEKGINLSGWLVQSGDGHNTEVVFTVRTSIKEVQFNDPRSGVAWRLCAHPDAQLASEVRAHADSIAAARSWLRVYDVGDLWLSLQTGDKELIALIKCITPPTQGIPDCHKP